MRKHRYFWLQIGHNNLEVRTEVLKKWKFSGFFGTSLILHDLETYQPELLVQRRKNTVTDDSDRLVTLNQIFVYIYNEKSN